MMRRRLLTGGDGLVLSVLRVCRCSDGNCRYSLICHCYSSRSVHFITHLRGIAV